MRNLLFSLLFISVNASSQDRPILIKNHVLQNFVQQAQDYSFEKDSTKKPFAYIGSLPDGLQVLRRLTDSITIVQINNREIIKSLSLQGKLIAVNNYWKLPPGFIVPATEKKTWLIECNDAAVVTSLFMPTDSVTIIGTAVSGKTIQLRASWQWVALHLLNHAAITFIAPTGEAFTERELTGFDLSANKGNMAHRTWPLINGGGRTISIKENKPDTADIDFKGRYIFSPLASQRMETHATTMATIAAGGGNSFYTGKGFAYGASITSSDFANLLPDADAELMRLGVTVQNHSYGTGIENYYGADAAAYDQQMNQLPLSLLHIFSAGNRGTAGSAAGNYAGINGFANITGSFKMSKNSIAVGAADSFGIVPVLSSRGPAYDGRLKPELVALGEDGSSGAAAIVSGIAALLQQAYEKKHNHKAESAIIRAVLFNSADDVGVPGPDYSSGYGMANAYRALQTIQTNTLAYNYVRNREEQLHQIQIPQGAKNLKITLSWTDHPAQTNAYKAIVNDLDLLLEHSASAQSWQPWVLNSFPHADSLRKTAVRKKDTLNNHEQITIDIPAAGTYTIKVSGTSVVTGAQEYAIAWQYDTTAHFTFSYPVKGDQLDPDRTNTIRWETSLSDTATLEYRLNGRGWLMAANGIDLAKKYFQWQPPDSFATIQFRLKTTGGSWLSDTAAVSRNLFINTGFNCTDSFLIYWQKASVDSYRVYRLGEKYLEPLITLTDTAFIQFKQNNPFSFFSVAPLLKEQVLGKLAYTFDYSKQQVGCYIIGFIADPVGNNAARLSLQLGTTYQVSKIVFEKLTARGFVAFREITPVLTTQFTITENAGKGLSIFRARVELKSGAVYYTQPEQVIIFGAAPYYVFPNPITPGSPLYVLAEEPDNKLFRLYDVFGRLVMKEPLIGLQNRLQMPLLQRGIYFYTIIQSNNTLLKGKLIVQ